MEGRRQTGSAGPASTASLSRASSADTGEPSRSLRACLSRTSSGMSMKTAPGSGPSLNRQSRFEKPVLSDVSPCLTTPRVLPSRSVIAASRGAALYQRISIGPTSTAMDEASR